MGKAMIAAASAAVLLAGCAGFEFYDNAALEGKETGIKFYTPKPYLLVARKDGKTVDISIVYLPDLSQPHYAKARSGWGSSNLTMKLADGAITEFGQQVDNGGATNFSSLASLATAVGAKLMRDDGGAERPEFSLYQIDTATNKLEKVAIPE